MALPLVAIVGRPNVGKSTMFNRILRNRLAITDDQPGVTRDRIYGRADWNGREFYLIDTGGYVPDSEDLIETMVREQATIAMQEADLIVFVVDAKTGPTSLDEEIAKRLLKQNRPVILVTNKADNEQIASEGYQFYNLGMGDPHPISSTNGLNYGDFLDVVVSKLPEKEEVPPSTALKIAILGRPNVGKSSMVNFLAGKSRQIVTDIPGTTRDSVDLAVKHKGREYILIDTAGLRKKSKVKENLEFFMSLRTIKALERADIVALLIEGQTGLLKQDIQIMTEITQAYKPLLVCINKWDLVEKDERTADIYRKEFKQKLPTLDYIPVVFMSAISGKKVTGIFSQLDKIDAERNKRVPTSELNDFLEKTLSRRHPPAFRGKYIKLNYMTQADMNPPTFIIFSNYPKYVKPDYVRYLENRLRENFGFEGVPIKLFLKKK